MSYTAKTEEISKAHLKYPKPYDAFFQRKAFESWLKSCSSDIQSLLQLPQLFLPAGQITSCEYSLLN